MHLERGEIEEASENSWLAASHMGHVAKFVCKARGAAAQIVKAVAMERGWECATDFDPHEIVTRLMQETSDVDYVYLFTPVSQLRWNAIEPLLPSETAEVYIKEVSKFVDKIEGLLSGG